MRAHSNIIIALSILFISCSEKLSQPILEKDKNALFKVNKLDSINNYYVIYSIKDAKKYKIVSKKETGEFVKCKNLLKENSYYNFELENLIPEVQSPNPLENKPTFPVLSCYLFDDDTKICEEKEMEILYKAKNLTGLCLDE
ncbi:MAG: hypothetical protein ACK5IC_11565 [Moheibacter sp.]